MTQQYCLVSMAARLSSTGISHHSLLPHIPLNPLSTVNSSAYPGIAPQFLNSSSQRLYLPGDLCSCPGYVWLLQRLILIPLRLPQVSCFTLSLKCFSSVIHLCSSLQSFPASGSSLTSQFFTSGGQSIGASASVRPMDSQD